MIFCLGIFGCSKHAHLPYLPAPVADGWRQKAAAENAYIVQKSDTIYSIAWAFGFDYRDLVNINKLSPPYKLHYGQHLYISKPTKYHGKNKKNGVWQPSGVINSSAPETITKEMLAKAGKWIWPVGGKISNRFDNKFGGNKGLNIAGYEGEAVLAASSGKVVYVGNGIRSYGNLIIIKHNDDYLSAYAYNKSACVKEGQAVQSGQTIAAMGRKDVGVAMLHFEIRWRGKPIDPLLLLPKKS